MFEWNDGAALYHYGIPGMKWGVQNGPPYPLGYKAKTSSERSETYQDKRYEKRTFGDKVKDVVSSDKFKKVVKIGAIAVGAALLAYGGYKVYTNYHADSVIDPTTGLPLIQGTRSRSEEYSD